MKRFTAPAGRSLWIKTQFAAPFRLIRIIMMQMRFLFAVLAFGIGLSGHAQSVQVDLLDQTYTVSANWWGIGGPFGSGISGSNSVVSASPTSYVVNYPDIQGEASAGLFQSRAYSETIQEQLDMNSFCYVSAASDISFSALDSQTANLNLLFTGYANWYQSDCLVSLNDVTSGLTLWEYGWTAYTGDPGTPQYINVPQMNMDDTLSLTVPTAFVAGHVYELFMNTDANANNDNGGAQVDLSGITPVLPIYFVPEPSAFFLLGLAAALLLIRRTRRWNLSRLVLRFNRW